MRKRLFKRLDAISVSEIRAITHLSLPKFARLLGVDIGTLRSWEHGRKEPMGPARVLLLAIRIDPATMLKALSV